jgi:DNA-binding NtrC family response regulator
VVKALLPDGLRMVEVACPEFNSSEGAFESDLFGHVKGAFTGADSDKPGLLLQAHKNVLFLDEVHTLSLTNQEKFLRFLQERKFRRKGDEKGLMIPVDFRLFTAAKPKIHAMVNDESFLVDLYHRLGRADIYIPPLRDRPEDIEPLVRHYQDHYNRKMMPANLQKQFRISTIREMEKFPWTANVRELETAVCNMMIKARGDIINPSDFDDYLKAVAAQSGSIAPALSTRSMVEVTDDVVREQIISALKVSRTRIEAAAKLGIDRSKLRLHVRFRSFQVRISQRYRLSRVEPSSDMFGTW